VFTLEVEDLRGFDRRTLDTLSDNEIVRKGWRKERSKAIVRERKNLKRAKKALLLQSMALGQDSQTPLNQGINQTEGGKEDEGGGRENLVLPPPTKMISPKRTLQRPLTAGQKSEYSSVNYERKRMLPSSGTSLSLSSQKSLKPSSSLFSDSSSKNQKKLQRPFSSSSVPSPSSSNLIGKLMADERKIKGSGKTFDSLEECVTRKRPLSSKNENFGQNPYSSEKNITNALTKLAVSHNTSQNNKNHTMVYLDEIPSLLDNTVDPLLADNTPHRGFVRPKMRDLDYQDEEYYEHEEEEEDYYQNDIEQQRMDEKECLDSIQAVEDRLRSYNAPQEIQKDMYVGRILQSPPIHTETKQGENIYDPQVTLTSPEKDRWWDESGSMQLYQKSGSKYIPQSVNSLISLSSQSSTSTIRKKKCSSARLVISSSLSNVLHGVSPRTLEAAGCDGIVRSRVKAMDRKEMTMKVPTLLRKNTRLSSLESDKDERGGGMVLIGSTLPGAATYSSSKKNVNE